MRNNGLFISKHLLVLRFMLNRSHWIAVAVMNQVLFIRVAEIKRLIFVQRSLVIILIASQDATTIYINKSILDWFPESNKIFYKTLLNCREMRF